MAIKSTPFNEGAPLDPAGLNNLRDDIVTTYTQSNNFISNSTINGQSQAQIFVGICGTVDLQFSSGKAGGKAIPVSALTNPYITTTIVSTTRLDEQITLYLMQSGTGYNLYGISSNAKSNALITVNWIAGQMKPS